MNLNFVEFFGKREVTFAKTSLARSFFVPYKKCWRLGVCVKSNNFLNFTQFIWDALELSYLSLEILKFIAPVMKHVIKYMSLESFKNPNDDNLIETPNLMRSRTINLHVTISVFITINYVANYVFLGNYDGNRKKEIRWRLLFLS